MHQCIVLFSRAHSLMHSAIPHSGLSCVSALTRLLSASFLQTADQRLLGGGQVHLVKLALHDGPDIFDGRQVGAAARIHTIPPKPRKDPQAPLLSTGRLVRRRAVMLENSL